MNTNKTIVTGLAAVLGLAALGLGSVAARAGEGDDCCSPASKTQYIAADAPTTKPAAAYPLDVCPVSGEKLGGDMGAPVVKQEDGRTVKFCCDECVKAFEKEPEKYNKKMDEMIVAKQKESYPLDTCVVTGDKLGGDMGAPINFVYRPTNQLVRFCCDGCVDTFKKTPEKYLAKIDKAAAKDAK